MTGGFESYTVEIDDGGDWDGDTPVTGSGVKGLTALMVAPVDECCLTPGDPSPIGRCPETGDLVYLDRPIDRARDAAEALRDALRAILPYAESRAEDMADRADENEETAANVPESEEAARTAAQSRAYADKAVAAVDAAKALLASLDAA